MTRETKIGIAMVLVMVGVFGFLVYKRAMRPAELVAQHETVDEENSETTNDDDDDVVVKKDRPSTLEIPDEPEILPVAGKIRSIPKEDIEDPQEDADEVDDPFSGAKHTRTPLASTPSKMPAMIPEEDVDENAETANESERFESNETSLVVQDRTPAETSLQPEMDDNDPFSGAVQQEKDEEFEPQQPALTAKSPPALDFGTAETNVPEEAAEEEFEPVRQVPVRQPAVRSFDATDEETTISARGTIPDKDLDFGDPEPEDEVETVETPPLRLPVAPAAPQLMLDDSVEDDRYGDYEPIELADAGDSASFGSPSFQSDASGRTGTGVATRQTTIAGDRHVVQPGENFWSISHKKYGTGRYFQALAAHNQRVVPDATKMKLGVEVSLPSADELERRYPTLVSPTGATEPAAASGANVNVPGEYLIAADGKPMYRIGSGDTLSGIAQRYLGRARRWEQIVVMNRDVLKDGNTLKVGAVLRLPNDATQLQLSNQPRNFR